MIQQKTFIYSEIYHIDSIHTLLANIKFLCVRFKNRKKSEPLTSSSFFFDASTNMFLYIPTKYTQRGKTFDILHECLRLVSCPTNVYCASLCIRHRVPGFFLRGILICVIFRPRDMKEYIFIFSIALEWK